MAITSLARHSPGKALFQVVRVRDFTGMEKTGKKIVGKVFVRAKSWLSNFSHLEDAIVSAYWLDRTRFFTLPSTGTPSSDAFLLS